MITTREINVNLTKGKPLARMTTKEIDASIKVTKPKNPKKPKSISTTTLPDVADIADKKKRDEIMAERKVAKKKPWNKMNAKERKEYQKAKKEEK